MVGHGVSSGQRGPPTCTVAGCGWSGRALRLAQFRKAAGDPQPQREGEAATVIVVRAGLVDWDEVTLGRHDSAQPDKTAYLTLGEARQQIRLRSEWVGSRHAGPPRIRADRPRWAKPAWICRAQPQRGPGSGPELECGRVPRVNDVEVVKLHSAEGAMDSLTERNDGGASGGELEQPGEHFRVEYPAVVSILKEVHERDRGGIDPAGSEGRVESAGGQAAVRPTDAHGACPRRAAFADEDQEGHALASGRAVAHERRG